MSKNRDRQVLTAGDVGTVPAAVVAPRVVVNGTGSFLPPGETPPAATPAPTALGRDALLAQHKQLTAEIRRLTAERDLVENAIATLDARLGLKKKLAAMTPAELTLLEETLAARAQQQIDAAGGA